VCISRKKWAACWLFGLFPNNQQAAHFFRLMHTGPDEIKAYLIQIQTPAVSQWRGHKAAQLHAWRRKNRFCPYYAPMIQVIGYQS